MLQSRKELKEILKYEQSINFGNEDVMGYLLEMVKNSNKWMTWKYIRSLRVTGYHYQKHRCSLYHSIMYIVWSRRKNSLGRKLGIELGHKTFDKGLTIYHPQGIVVNGNCKIGKNCKLHGNNCIGNDGYSDGVPVLGDNVRLGVGAKVIGEITIANNTVIAAGAVVVKDIKKEGTTVAGIPAKIIGE